MRSTIVVLVLAITTVASAGVAVSAWATRDGHAEFCEPSPIDTALSDESVIVRLDGSREYAFGVIRYRDNTVYVPSGVGFASEPTLRRLDAPRSPCEESSSGTGGSDGHSPDLK